VIVVRTGVRGLVRVVARAWPGRVPAAVGFTAMTPVAGDSASILVELGLLFAKAGAFVFGSGLAIVPFLREGLVVDNQWLNEQQFVDSVAVGLITPGPVVITVAFAGYLIAGLPGAIVAAVGVFTPVYLFVILPGPWIARHKDAPIVQAFVAGVSAAACGAIIAASVLIGRDAIRDPVQAVIFVAALAALLTIRRFKPRHLTSVAEPVLVVVAAIVGLFVG
jgi:chromate transporter